MNHPLTTGQLAEQLQRFAPDTPCVVHLWVADDFEDVAPELTSDEVLATIALADATLDADISLSWYFLRHCADTVLAKREEKSEHLAGFLSGRVAGRMLRGAYAHPVTG